MKTRYILAVFSRNKAGFPRLNREKISNNNVKPNRFLKKEPRIVIQNNCRFFFCIVFLFLQFSGNNILSLRWLEHSHHALTMEYNSLSALKSKNPFDSAYFFMTVSFYFFKGLISVTPPKEAGDVSSTAPLYVTITKSPTLKSVDSFPTKCTI